MNERTKAQIEFDNRVRNLVFDLVKRKVNKLYADFLSKENNYLINSIKIDHDKRTLIVNLQLQLQTEKMFDIALTAAGQVSHAAINKTSDRIKHLYACFCNFFEQLIFEVLTQRYAYIDIIDCNTTLYNLKGHVNEVLYRKRYNLTTKKYENIT